MEQIRLDRDSHTYWLGKRRVPGYSEIVKDLGVSGDNPFWTEAGRDEGNAIHLWLGFLAAGKVPSTPPDPRIAGRVEGIRKFIRDTGFKIVGGVTPLYDPISRFACSPDMWGFIGNWSFVIDAKRGTKLATHRLQTAAQTVALRSNGFRAQKRAALYLRDGDYRLDQHSDFVDLARWQVFVSAYHAKREYQ